MNRIRKNWKNNGTPFYFTLSLNGVARVHLSQDDCIKYDKVMLDDNHTLMDVLVDLYHVRKSLEQVEDTLVRSSVFQALLDVFNNTQYLFQISQNYGK